MSEEITVRTNNVPRPIIDDYELTPAEKLEFDYLPWEDIDNGGASASFVRFKGMTYDLGEFMTTSGLPEFNPLRQWDGYRSDSFFSGVVVRFVGDDHVIMGTFFA